MSRLPPAPFTELKNDEAILSFIFDPHRTFIGASLPPDTSASKPGPSDAAPKTAEEEEHAELTKLEQAAVAAAEMSDFDSALTMLTRLIGDETGDATGAGKVRASAYNNRAQVKRLKNDVEGAKKDLDKAIELAHAYVDACGKPASLVEFNRSVLKQAYTQRAIYHHSVGNTKAEEQDMAAAAAFGSTLARIMTTGVNPYAALCSNAFQKMVEGPQPPSS